MTSEFGSVGNPGSVEVEGPRHSAASSQQVLFIQILRGIAPLLVVWSHLPGYILWKSDRQWVVNDLYMRFIGGPFHVYQHGGHLGVIIFFLISGYIISLASMRESRSSFAIKRIFRLFPALIVALIVVYFASRLSVAFGTGDLPNVKADLGVVGYLHSLFLIDHLFATPSVLSVTWTLTIEIAFYVAIFALLPMTHRAPMKATWIILFGYVLLMIAILAIPGLKHLGGTLIYLPFLLLGRAAFLWRKGMANGAQIFSFVGLTSLLYLTFYTSYFPGLLLTEGVEPLVTYVAAPLIFVAAMSTKIKRIPRVFDFLGDISYSVYLLHLPVGMLTIDLAVTAGAPFTLAFVAALAAVLGVSTLSYKWVEQPMQKVARRLTSRSETGSRPALDPV